jgi:ribonuclease E
MKKEMLINVLQPEECRIAIIEDGVLEELYVERTSQESYVGNIYKGRIVNIEPSIQAAFVDFGIGRNGFLHVSDVDPVYYKHLLPKELLAELEAQEEEDQPKPRAERENRREERRPRLTYPESSVTVAEATVVAEPDKAPATEPAEAEFSVVESEDDGFLSGLDAEEELVTITAAPAPAPVQETVKPAPTSPPVAAPKPVELIEDDGFAADLFDEPVPAVMPVLIATPPVPSVPPVAVPAPPAPAPVEEEDEFGAGLDFSTTETVLLAPAPRTPEPAAESLAEVQPAEPQVNEESEKTGEDADKPSSEAKPKRTTKPRAKAKAKADEPEADDESKAKAKTRRTKKKADSEEEGADGDDKPRPMAGAERRTHADDDEPEIKPFFGSDGGDDFDVDAPNDRFASSSSQPEEEFEVSTSDDDLPSGEPEESEDEQVETSESAPQEEDEDEFAPPVRNYEERDNGGRGGQRGRGGDRGGPRGGRNGDRGGPRGGRNGDRGGPRGGSNAGGGGPGRSDRKYPRMAIQDIFKRGQEVIIQVIKEGIGTKGPTLTTFISIAGRYLVLMPHLNRVGVSRKIEDVDTRKRLREVMTKLAPPKGLGFIVRTAASDRNERELHNDLVYLLRLWQVVVRRLKKMPSPVEVYRESDMITRTIRDIFTSDIDTIFVDEANAFAHASEFLQIVMPRFADRIRYHSDIEPLFNKYRIEEEIQKINHKRIDLPQGGSIIIEQTEALVAIDVNSGTFRADNNAEETAYRMNMLAAKEIARQLRLRDLGGVIVNDFIDMRDEKHRRNVENVLRDALKRDRARTKILRISQFGIIEMTRQRIQPSLKKRIFNDCPHCKGTGYIKTDETMSIDVIRLLQLAAHRAPLIAKVTVNVHAEVAFYLLNKKRKDISGLEERSKMEIQVDGQFNVSPEHLEFRCFDQNGVEVRLFNPTAAPPRMFRGQQPRELPERRPRNLD